MILLCLLLEQDQASPQTFQESIPIPTLLYSKALSLRISVSVFGMDTDLDHNTNTHLCLSLFFFFNCWITFCSKIFSCVPNIPNHNPSYLHPTANLFFLELSGSFLCCHTDTISLLLQSHKLPTMPSECSSFWFDTRKRFLHFLPKWMDMDFHSKQWNTHKHRRDFSKQKHDRFCSRKLWKQRKLEHFFWIFCFCSRKFYTNFTRTNCVQSKPPNK